jgi:hypothetical protein
MKKFRCFKMVFILFCLCWMAIQGQAFGTTQPASAVDNVCVDVPCDVTVISDQQPYRNVRVLAITDQNIRLGAAHYRAEGLTLDRNIIQKIVFKGGDEGATGIVLRNGLNFNGTIERFINGIFTVRIDGIEDSELTLKLGDILSINFREPAPRQTPGGSQGSWKYLTSKNIFEWIYADSETIALKNAKFNLNIEKIALASNQIVLTAKAWHNNFHSRHCGIICTLEDDMGTPYPEITTPVGKILGSREKAQSFNIQGPAPAEDAQLITIKLKPYGIEKGIYQCGDIKQWSVLPQFSLEMLK